MVGSEHNGVAKIRDGETIWHRLGDVGYFDERQRFWYCGRKSQRVVTSEGTLYTECVEAQFAGYRSRAALVGIRQNDVTEPVIVLEHPKVRSNPPFQPHSYFERHEKERQDREPAKYVAIDTYLVKYSFPTDIRHNSKIRREELAAWAEKQLKKQH